MAEYHIQPGFFSGAHGDLYKLDVMPIKDMRAQVMYLPPHGEELNRCRSLIAAQARVFAQNGIGCRVVDYFGSGDSDGDFSEGTLEIWQQDLATQVNELKANSSVPVYLVGFRLGALLAASYINNNVEAIKGALFIQPVIQGKQYVTQLLRQRMAGQMGAGVNTESTDQMRESILAGNNLEIGGYEFNSKLLIDIEKLSLTGNINLINQEIFWLEFEQNLGKGLSIGSQRAVDGLKDLGNSVEAECVFDPPIWQLHERASANKNLEFIKRVALKW